MIRILFGEIVIEDPKSHHYMHAVLCKDEFIEKLCSNVSMRQDQSYRKLH